VDQFEHVMVLISVILGLGIAQILLGLARIVDWHASTDKRSDLCLSHLAWLIHVLIWMVLFWWWQFRIAEADRNWTLGLYLFLVLYAISLFLLAVTLVPLSGERIDSFRSFFLERRRWFFGIFLAATALDIGEGFVKGGWDRIVDHGPLVWGLWVLAVVICSVGIKTRQTRLHNIMAVTYLLYNVAISFIDLPTLGS